MRLKKQGFTLIELLVVIAIIGILASVVLAALNSARSKARDATRLAQMEELSKALQMYYNDTGSYPFTGVTACGSRGNSCYSNGNCSDTNSQWSTALNVLVTGKYIATLPKDPLNNGTVGGANPKYCYAYIKENGSSAFDRCRDKVTGAYLNPGDYEFLLYFSLENPNNYEYTLDWNSLPNPPANACLPGPHV